MAPVAGRPYLEHLLGLLREQSITEIVLLTGHLGEQIEAYFGDGGGHGLSIQYSREQTPLGTGGALREARDLLADTFLVLYGDVYLPIAYMPVVHTLEQSTALGIDVVYDNRLADTTVKNNIAIDGDGYVACYRKDQGDSDQLTHVDAGVMAFRKAAVDLLPMGAVSMEKELFPRLIARRQLLAYSTSQRFYDIGTPERLRVIAELLTHDHHAHSLSN